MAEGIQPDFELALTNPYGMNGQNGRVIFSDRQSAGGPAPENFPGYSYEKTAEKGFEADMIRGNWETNPVSSGFFSPENIVIIQNGIRREVFDKSQPKGHIIDNQSVDELKIIMRALYLSYGRNAPFDIQGQITDLNRKVLDWSVPHILSAIDHYHYYLNDISHMPIPLAREMNLSSAGTKSMPFNNFV